MCERQAGGTIEVRTKSTKGSAMSATDISLDPAKLEARAGQLMSIFTGSMLNAMIDIGHRTGLFQAAAEGPATSDGLAARAGLTERYVREWLGAMVTGGLARYQPEGSVYTKAPGLP